MNIKVAKKETVWHFWIPEDFNELVKKNGEPHKQIQKMISILVDKDMEWDIAHYKEFVAFKNSCDRLTTIYPKWYWECRMRESFKRLDVIKL